MVSPNLFVSFKPKVTILGPLKKLLTQKQLFLEIFENILLLSFKWIQKYKVYADNKMTFTQNYEKQKTLGISCCIRQKKDNRIKLRQNIGSNESIQWGFLPKNLRKKLLLGKSCWGA